MAGPRVFSYSHDGYGLGHLRRNLRIMAGLRRSRPDLEVLLATGARGADRLTAPFGMDCVTLPPVVKIANGRYAADGQGATVDGVLRRRSALLADAVREFRPDLLLVDRYPRGMHGEMDDALATHRGQRPDAPAVFGPRDIIDVPVTVQDEWRSQGHSEAIRDLYELVLCYGDPAVFDPVVEYALPQDVAERVRFTGYLADELWATDTVGVRRRHAARDRRLAVCTLGGGRDASPVAETFLSAMSQLALNGWAGVLITGPYMPDDDVDRLTHHPAAAHVEIIRLVADLASYLAAADAVLCMGGYNTTCEVLALAVPAVIVPRVHPRLEQLMRAHRLADRGLVRWLHPDALSGGAVARALDEIADVSRHELVERIGGLRHNGIHESVRHLEPLLARSTAARIETSSRMASRGVATVGD